MSETEGQPPLTVRYGLDEALELLAALEEARDVLAGGDHIAVRPGRRRRGVPHQGIVTWRGGNGMAVLQPRAKRRWHCRIPYAALAGSALVSGALLGAYSGTAPGQLVGTISPVAQGSLGQPTSFDTFHGVLTVELLSGGNVVKRTPVQSGGEFHVTVAAGTYELALAGTSVCHGRATVKPHAKTSVVIVCA